MLMYLVTLVCYTAFAVWLMYKGYHYHDDDLAGEVMD